MPRTTTPSFVTEVELLPTPRQAKKMRARFEVARQVYNACLGEVLRRLRLMRESRHFQKARRLKGAERTKAFREANRAFGFSEYDLKKWATQFTRTWINEHIGSQTVEAITSTAFNTGKEYLFSRGQRSRPTFRRKSDIRAVDGRTGSCCRWKEDRIEWKGLAVPVSIDTSDPVVQHGLSCDVKYVRMVRRVIRGRERYFAQLVCKGEPYRKPSHQPNRGIVGIDIGTQTIAAVGDDKATLEVFCGELQRQDRAVRRIQRRLDRSRRATNPDNYNSDGTIRKLGNKRLMWNQSKAYQKERKRLADLRRKEADFRKNLHGQLIARILKLGSDIRMEKLNIQSFARKAKPKGTRRRKRFGKSVGFRAPGMFISRLKLEADKWGASVDEFNTRTTKLSQTCHCGHVEKKPLSQRWHRCKKCGAIAQRDLYSAFLARFVEEGTLRADQAKKAWTRTCAALEAALSDVQDTNGSLPSSVGLRSRRQSDSPLKDGKNVGKNPDVVGGVKTSAESREEPTENHQNTAFLQRESSLNSVRKTGCDPTGCGYQLNAVFAQVLHSAQNVLQLRTPAKCGVREMISVSPGAGGSNQPKPQAPARQNQTVT